MYIHKSAKALLFNFSIIHTQLMKKQDFGGNSDEN